MKVVTVACVLAALAGVECAPTLSEGHLPQRDTIPVQSQEEQFYRDKRSSYGTPYYAPSPCGAAAYPSIPSPAYHLAPVQHAYPPHGYGYMPHYRDMDEQEMMSFSDMDPVMAEHLPMGRYAYGPAAPYGGLPSHGGVAPSSNVAFGVFPNANTGGCSVPLLLSCSPNIVHGKMVKTQSPYAYSTPGAYRGVDQDSHHDLLINHETGDHELATNEHAHQQNHHAQQENHDTEKHQ